MLLKIEQHKIIISLVQHSRIIPPIHLRLLLAGVKARAMPQRSFSFHLLYFFHFFYHQFIVMASFEYEMALEKSQQNCKIYSIKYHFVERIWKG